MQHEFIILINGKLEIYHNYDDIPKSFDNVIKFSPSISPGPHTHDDHDEIDEWTHKLKLLLQRETNGNKHIS